MMKALADRLAEAFAEKLHADVRTRHWGYSKDEALSTQELLQVGAGHVLSVCAGQGIGPLNPYAPYI